MGRTHVEPEDNSVTLHQFLRSFENAISGFINGDAGRWKAIASHGDDVTIMGAWGAAERGWTEASPRYDWAAARFE